MTSMVPLYALNQVHVTLPYLQRCIDIVYTPEVYFRLTSCSQLRIVLPCDIEYGAWLLQDVHSLVLNVSRFPYQDVGLVAAGRHESVRFVPA